MGGDQGSPSWRYRLHRYLRAGTALRFAFRLLQKESGASTEMRSAPILPFYASDRDEISSGSGSWQDPRSRRAGRGPWAGRSYPGRGAAPRRETSWCRRVVLNHREAWCLSSPRRGGIFQPRATPWGREAAERPLALKGRDKRHAQAEMRSCALSGLRGWAAPIPQGVAMG
jgi:hypothetical protein